MTDAEDEEADALRELEGEDLDSDDEGEGGALPCADQVFEEEEEKEQAMAEPAVTDQATRLAELFEDLVARPRGATPPEAIDDSFAAALRALPPPGVIQQVPAGSEGPAAPRSRRPRRARRVAACSSVRVRVHRTAAGDCNDGALQGGLSPPPRSTHSEVS